MLEEIKYMFTEKYDFENRDKSFLIATSDFGTIKILMQVSKWSKIQMYPLLQEKFFLLRPRWYEWNLSLWKNMSFITELNQFA